MTLTAAERARRYRAHKRGDHSLCDPDRPDCDGSAVTLSQEPSRVTRDGDVTPPASLGERGRRLWRATVPELPEITVREQVLLEEACRIADRLDRLDRLLVGDAADWVALVEDRGDPERQIVVIDKPLGEARQQAVALKTLLAELRQGRLAAGKQQPATKAAQVAQPAGQPPPAANGAGGVVRGGGVVSIAVRAAARRAQATG